MKGIFRAYFYVFTPKNEQIDLLWGIGVSQVLFFSRKNDEIRLIISQETWLTY
jgi:hypothetical protein